MKNRRNFLQKISALVALVAINPISKKANAVEVKLSSTLVHHVFFWLKEPENKLARKQFEAALDALIKIENIRLTHIGVPASTEQREVVDHTYTYSYMAFFNSKKDQDAYQIHPIHLKFVEKNSHLWNKVVVYDSVDI